MANDINIGKIVYPRATFERVIDREFKFFVPDEEVVDTDTIDDLFRLYDKFYYDIPARGNRSHEYLRDRSAEIAGFPQESTDVRVLLQEISNLRSNNASLTAQNTSLTIQLATASIPTPTNG